MGRPAVSDLHDALDDMTGLDWIPGMSKILAGFREAAHAAENGQFTLDATQTGLTVLANTEGDDIPNLIGLLVAHLTDASTNTTLTVLDDQTRKNVQHRGELHAFETAHHTPREHPNEAAALIYEAAERGAPAMNHLDDDQRKELSDKVRKVNKQSESRPR